MGILGKSNRLQKNRAFGYSSRYYEDKGKGNPYKLEHPFDKFRTTVDTPRGLKGKFNQAMDDMRNPADSQVRLRLVLIIAVLIFLFLYIIDFDLSIFYTANG